VIECERVKEQSQVERGKLKIHNVRSDKMEENLSEVQHEPGKSDENLNQKLERKEERKDAKIRKKEKESEVKANLDQKAELESPVILVWTSSAPMEQKGIEFIAKKEFGSCRLTMDRSALSQSIAVVFFNFHRKLDPLDIPNPKTR